MTTENESEYETDLVSERKAPEPEKPNTIRVLTEMFDAYKRLSHHAPYGFDNDSRVAARQWVKRQEPQHPTTEQAELIDKRGGGQYWKSPYLDRLRLNLLTFLSMNFDDQRFVVNTQDENGIHWRGEPIDVFRVIVAHRTKTG